MKNRYRVEIYDDVKANDLTIYSESNIDKEYLTEIVFSNMRQFSGNIRAYVYDNLKKKKTTALILPMELISKYKPTKLTSEEIGLSYSLGRDLSYFLIPPRLPCCVARICEGFSTGLRELSTTPEIL